MKIYFAGSIRGGRADRKIYLRIIESLSQIGTVLTEHVGDQSLTASGEATLNHRIYRRDMRWLKEADVLVAEVTTPSLGVGYEIAAAESLGKPIICLYRNTSRKGLSAMIAGNRALSVYLYNSPEQIKWRAFRFLKESTIFIGS